MRTPYYREQALEGIAREVIADRFQNAIDRPVDIIETAAVKAVEVIIGAVHRRFSVRLLAVGWVRSYSPCRRIY